MPHSSIADSAPHRAASVLIIRPAVRAAYYNLQQWLADQGTASLTAYAGPGADGVDQLRAALAPQPVYAAPIRSGWQSLGPLLRRDETVVILCADSAQAISGFTLVQVLQGLPRRDSAVILSKLVRSDRIVLLGPQVTQVLPGLRGVFAPRHARELAALAGAVGIALATTAVAVVAIGVQEALVRMKVLR